MSMEHLCYFGFGVMIGVFTAMFAIGLCQAARRGDVREI